MRGEPPSGKRAPAEAGEAARTDEFRFVAVADLPGVDFMLARQSAHLWRVYHDTFTCCVIPELGNPRTAASFWRYRRWSQTAHPGDCLMMEPGEVHDSWKVAAAASYFVVRFAADVVTGVAAELGWRSFPHLRACQTPSPALQRDMDALRRSCCTDATPLERQSRLARALRQLLATCGEAVSRPRLRDVAISRVQLARDFIVEHGTQRITLDDLVALTGVSRFHLLRSFTKQFGVPPHRFQILVRLSRAEKLLRHGCPPGAIDVGFADQSHLTRHFRRSYGVPPAAFQRLVRASAPQLEGLTAEQFRSRPR